MKLQDCKKAYEDLSGIASEQARKLAFAGIAIVWIYRIGSGPDVAVPEALHLPVVLFAAGLAVDLLQYVTGTGIWFVYFRYREWLASKRGRSRDDSFFAPVWLPAITWGLWLAKLLLIGAGYVFLFRYLLPTLM